MQEGLAQLREFRYWRAEEIGRKLEKVGIADAFEGAKAFSSGPLIGRWLDHGNEQSEQTEPEKTSSGRGTPTN